MSEADEVTGAAPAARTAGGILREARQAQGLHIAALAATIKVQQKKLELLEADRVDELPDATFTRALAQTVCRALKIDPAPVLALLPQASGYRLEHVSEGINEPFRDKPGRREPSDWSMIASPAVWGPLLLLAAAVVIYFVPTNWLDRLQPTEAPATAASGPAAGASAPEMMSTGEGAPGPGVTVSTAPLVVPEPASAPAQIAPAPAPGQATTASAPLASAALAASAPAMMPAPAIAAAPAATASTSTSPTLQIRTRAPSWIEVQDGRGKTLVARTVQAGEALSLDGPAPLRLKVGNVGGTEVTYRGQPLDLAANSRDNVARVQLK